jgi:O-acetyl-ADP-ribose deacetylase (regulator of RNase III)
MMDRIIDPSISGNIRYGGAEKDANGAVLVDTIARDLRGKLSGRVYVGIGTVVDTEPGALASPPTNVKRIVHVAAVDGIGPGKGVRADAETLSTCLASVLEHVHEQNGRSTILSRLFNKPCRSILVPLFGTGQGGLTVGQVTPRLVSAAVDFFNGHPQTDLKEVYLLAYRGPDKDACMKALLERSELQQVDEAAAAGSGGRPTM